MEISIQAMSAAVGPQSQMTESEKTFFMMLCRKYSLGDDVSVRLEAAISICAWMWFTRQVGFAELTSYMLVMSKEFEDAMDMAVESNVQKVDRALSVKCVFVYDRRYVSFGDGGYNAVFDMVSKRFGKVEKEIPESTAKFDLRESASRLSKLVTSTPC